MAQSETNDYVLGIDRDGRALALARERAAAARCTDWVEFQEAGLDEFSTDKQFDALIGRFILLYLPDAAATIRRLLEFVRPGGIVVFHEIDFSRPESSDPPCEIWDKAYGLVSEAFRKAGFPPEYGRRVGKSFVDAGLVEILEDAVTRSGSQLMGPTLVGAWARKPV